MKVNRKKRMAAIMPRGKPKASARPAAAPSKASKLNKGTKASKPNKGSGNGANLGFEAQLFLAADKLRKNLEPSDYKHVALGLIFLKYISNAFEAKHAALLAEDPVAAEDQDEYLAENVFWVPKKARWSHLQDNAKQPTIGKLIDDAMSEIEKANPSLKGVLPKDYNRPALDKIMLGELIDLVSGIAMGEPDDKARDILGRADTSTAGLSVIVTISIIGFERRLREWGAPCVAAGRLPAHIASYIAAIAILDATLL
jgi:type I restriction enzyme M protein